MLKGGYGEPVNLSYKFGESQALYGNHGKSCQGGS